MAETNPNFRDIVLVTMNYRRLYGFVFMDGAVDRICEIASWGKTKNDIIEFMRIAVLEEEIKVYDEWRPPEKTTGGAHELPLIERLIMRLIIWFMRIWHARK